LGFDVAGAPILPLASGAVDPDVLRRERLGWEEISHRSAKIVTFIGRSFIFGYVPLVTKYQIWLAMRDILRLLYTA
jgi:hypothetical protein